jgi:hypothetical protein
MRTSRVSQRPPSSASASRRSGSPAPRPRSVGQRALFAAATGRPVPRAPTDRGCGSQAGVRASPPVSTAFDERHLRASPYPVSGAGPVLGVGPAPQGRRSSVRRSASSRPGPYVVASGRTPGLRSRPHQVADAHRRRGHRRADAARDDVDLGQALVRPRSGLVQHRFRTAGDPAEERAVGNCLR